MFKVLFIIFVSKQLLGNVTSDINIYSAKQSIIRLGKLSDGNSDRTIAYLKRTNFCVYLFLRAKKSYFVGTYFCKWQVFENFEFIDFSPKEKRI